MLRRGIVLAFGALLLSGCQMGVDVQVSGTPYAPTFTLRDAGLFGRGAVFPAYLAVYDIADGARPIWTVKADRLEKVRLGGRIQYGRTPPGAVQSTPAEPLREGRIYEVAVGGGGYFGGAYFKIVGDRLVSVRGTGDASRREIQAL